MSQPTVPTSPAAPRRDYYWTQELDGKDGRWFKAWWATPFGSGCSLTIWRAKGDALKYAQSQYHKAKKENHAAAGGGK